MSKNGGLTHYIGGCNDCGKEWATRNVVGLAAQHAKKTGHSTWAELGHTYIFNHDKNEQKGKNNE